MGANKKTKENAASNHAMKFFNHNISMHDELGLQMKNT